MVTNKHVREFALSLSGVVEQPHFEKASFRANKKIFASLNEPDAILCIKLSVIDQDIFCKAGPMVYPVPNKWGKQGWTFIQLKKINKPVLEAALTAAHETVLKKNNPQPPRKSRAK